MRGRHCRQILAEVHGTGSSSKRVQESYEALLQTLGSELSILRSLPLQEIQQAGGELLAEGIRRVRSGDVHIEGGYDGEYGIIKLFDDTERAVSKSQIDLFGAEDRKKHPRKTAKEITPAPLAKADALPQSQVPKQADAPQQSEILQPSATLNDEQLAAVNIVDRPLLIVAGPGTGKTRTLTVRIAHLIQDLQVDPSAILAITFTHTRLCSMGMTRPIICRARV